MPTLIELFARTELAGGCRLWRGPLDKDGYGCVHITVGRRRTHRVVYELTIGPIPAGHDIDHTCWNRACCEPSHLRALPARENRSLQRSALSGHCKHGHRFTAANTYYRKNAPSQRQCRTCNAEAVRRYKARAA